MCNRARLHAEPETLFERFGARWAEPRPMDNRFNPRELTPRSRAYVVRQDRRGPGIDVMGWDVLDGGAPYPMTNVRNLGLRQWRALAADPAQRCLERAGRARPSEGDDHGVGARRLGALAKRLV